MTRPGCQTFVTYRGTDMLLSEAMQREGCALTEECVRSRLRRGWHLLRALTLPVANSGAVSSDIPRAARRGRA